MDLLLQLALRNVMRNKRRSVVTLLAIAFGIASSSILTSLARGLSTEMVDSAINNLTGHIQIHSPEYRSDPAVENNFSFPNEELKSELEKPPIIKWAARVRVPAVVMSERESRGVTLVGSSLEEEKNLSFIADSIVEGEYPGLNDSGILLGKSLVEQLQTKLGRKIVILAQNQSGKVSERGFRIVGLFDTELESNEKSFAFIGRETAQKMLGLDKNILEISIRASNRDQLAPVVDRLKQVSPGLDVAAWTTLEPLVTAIVEMQNGIIYIWFFIVIITIAFGLANTLIMSIMERVKEIGLYQALGMRKFQVVLEVIFESLILLFVGAIIGNIVCLLSVSYLQKGIDLSAFSQGTQMYGMSSIVYPNLLSKDLLAVNIIALGIGILASFYPAWRAGRLNPANALTR